MKKCCEEFDNATLINAYNEYRRRHELLLPEEIKKIRREPENMRTYLTAYAIDMELN